MFSKKTRNLSNENIKMQRFSSDHPSKYQKNGQQQNWQDFGQNQISVHSQSKGNSLLNMPKGNNGDTLADWQQASTLSSKASTNDNSNSDVEIIDDDYAKSLQSVPLLF